MYVTFTFICHNFIDSSISGSNIQAIMPTTMLAYLVIHNIFVYDVYMNDCPKLNVSFVIYIWSNILFNKKMIKIAYIYVSITSAKEEEVDSLFPFGVFQFY